MLPREYRKSYEVNLNTTIFMESAAHESKSAYGPQKSHAFSIP